MQSSAQALIWLMGFVLHYSCFSSAGVSEAQRVPFGAPISRRLCLEKEEKKKHFQITCLLSIPLCWRHYIKKITGQSNGSVKIYEWERDGFYHRWHTAFNQGEAVCEWHREEWMMGAAGKGRSVHLRSETQKVIRLKNGIKGRNSDTHLIPPSFSQWGRAEEWMAFLVSLLPSARAHPSVHSQHCWRTTHAWRHTHRDRHTHTKWQVCQSQTCF